MNRRHFFQSSAVGTIAASLVPNADAALESTGKKEAKRLLFWDLSKLEYWDNLKLEQGEPVWQEDASYVDPFEDGKRGGNFPVVWRDQESGRWRMVYSVKWSPYTMMLADSEDGIHWEPLPQPQIQPDGGKLAPNHIHTIPGAGGGGVFVDWEAADGYHFKVWARQHSSETFPRALANPDHHWHQIAVAEGEKRYMTEGITHVSKDGLHWEEAPQYAWDSPGWRPEPPIFAFRHHQKGRYGMMVRPGWGDRRQCICFTEGDDFTQWSEPEMLFQPDPLDVDAPIDMYGLPVMPCGEGYVGCLWIFHNSSSRPVKSYNNFFGVMDAELVFSYDGIRWFRGHRKPFVKRNPLGKPGCLQIRPSSFVETETEVLIYSEAAKAAHGLERSSQRQTDEPLKSIEVHTLRRDGHMLLRSKGDFGKLQTKPFTIWKPEFTVNADTSYGEMRFQLTDEKSQPIEGFAFEDSVPLRRKSVFSEPLRWKQASLESVVRKVIRLEVEIRNAELFSFTAPYHFVDAQDMWMLKDGKPIDTSLFDY